jgi:transcriptional regulator with XRE-family HTH domain
MNIAKILIDEIRKGPDTMYRIAKETGIDASALTRLVKGERELSLKAAGKVLEYLGYEIRKRKG